MPQFGADSAQNRKRNLCNVLWVSVIIAVVLLINWNTSRINVSATGLGSSKAQSAISKGGVTVLPDGGTVRTAAAEQGDNQCVSTYKTDTPTAQCQPFCNVKFKKFHCMWCKCRACDFCPKGGEAIEEAAKDAPPPMNPPPPPPPDEASFSNPEGVPEPELEPLDADGSLPNVNASVNASVAALPATNGSVAALPATNATIDTALAATAAALAKLASSAPTALAAPNASGALTAGTASVLPAAPSGNATPAVPLNASQTAERPITALSATGEATTPIVSTTAAASVPTTASATTAGATTASTSAATTTAAGEAPLLTQPVADGAAQPDEAHKLAAAELAELHGMKQEDSYAEMGGAKQEDEVAEEAKPLAAAVV